MIHPGANFSANVVDGQEAWRQLKENQVDFAAVGTPVENLQVYELVELATEELVLIVPIDNALGSKNKISVTEVLKQPFISREVGSGTRKEIEGMLRRAGHSWSEFNVVSQLWSTEAAISAVQQGIGLSIVSSMAAEKAARSKLIKTIHLSDLDATRKLFLAKRKVHASKKHLARDLCGEFWCFIVSRRPLPPA